MEKIKYDIDCTYPMSATRVQVSEQKQRMNEIKFLVWILIVIAIIF